ncbi:hypothetical protein GN956_G13968 [Arapaima gigas]
MDQCPQDETVDFKSLRAKFQEEGLLKQFMSKPTVPDKPKVVPPPGPRTSLLSSINTAVENKMPVIPRVVFKDDKKVALTTPTTFKIKNAAKEPTLNTAVTDHVQKKGENIVKQALKDKKLPFVQPISIMQEKSNPKPNPLSSVQYPPPRQWEAIMPSKLSKTSSPENEFSPVTECSSKSSSILQPKIKQINPKDSKPERISVPSEINQPSELQSPRFYIPAQSPPTKKATLALKSIKITHPETEFSQTTEGSSKPVSTSEPVRTLAQIGVEVPKLENGNLTPSIPQLPISHVAAKPTSAEGNFKSVQPVFKTPPCDRRVLKALEKAKQKVPLKNVPLDEDQSNTANLATLQPELPSTDYENIPAKGWTKQLPSIPSFLNMSLPPVTEINGPSQKPQVAALKNLSLHDQLDAALLKAPEGFDSPHLEASEIPELHTSKSEDVECQNEAVPYHEGLQHEAVEDYHETMKNSFLEAPHQPNGGVLGEKVATNETREADLPSTAVGLSVTYTHGLQEQSPVYSNKRTKAHKAQSRQKRKDPLRSKSLNIFQHLKLMLLCYRQDKSAHTESPEGLSDKELKKKEKQRLEKEKKEQKEQEKKENQMKKKFKLTGHEEVVHQAKVSVASKGRKNELPTKVDDTVSIIRTTNCPKGMWLARDNNNKYGYIPVKNVELDVKEILELGIKASQAKGRTTVDGEDCSTGSRNSNHYPLSTGSFTDDSEEWSGDEDEPMSPTDNSGHIYEVSQIQERPYSLPEPQQGSTTVGSNTQVRHEALRKLETFFMQQDGKSGITENAVKVATQNSRSEEQGVTAVEEAAYLAQEENPELLDMMILPPPEHYADS